MREYLKSLGSLSWALSLFGLKNLGGLMTFSGFRRRGRRPGGSVAGLEAVTKAVAENLGSFLQAIFHSGDRFVHGLMDLSFGRRRSAATRMPWLNRQPGPASTPPRSPFTSPSSSSAAAENEPPRSPFAASGSPSPPSAEVPPVSGWGPMPPIPETPPASASPPAKSA